MKVLISKEGQLHLCQDDKDRSSTDLNYCKLKIRDFCIQKVISVTKSIL